MSSCRYSQSISACWYFVEWSTKIEKVNINKNHSFLIPYILSQTRNKGQHKALYWSYPHY